MKAETPDLSGRIFGRLMVLRRGRSDWLCRCECNASPEIEIPADILLSGRRKSCGCICIMGLDLSSNSGWAVKNSKWHRTQVPNGVISVSDKAWEEKYAVFAIKFLPLLRQYKPDFVAIERPEHGVRQFAQVGRPDLTGEAHQAMTINPAALQLTGIAGAAIGVLALMNTPYGTIAANSWRPTFFGKGFKPAPQEIRDQKTGKIKYGKPDWKQAAIDMCEREHIDLPPTKKDQKDAAEAVAVCTCWTKCDVPAIEWMQKRFLDLRTGAYRKEAA